ncbi:peptidoglycan DD-metalloendopeptidase family protein [Micromonospora sp. NPDC023644]|uniref:murein hydrolase activator EnvC family protein n=1 Tax=Micromonospora sp. NPDC023644 TaxID=3154321 RepID=UPI0033EC62A7
MRPATRTGAAVLCAALLSLGPAAAPVPSPVPAALRPPAVGGAAASTSGSGPPGVVVPVAGSPGVGSPWAASSGVASSGAVPPWAGLSGIPSSGVPSFGAVASWAPALRAARFRWPLDGVPRPVRRFDPPPRPWLPGHRGVDLAAAPGATVRAAGAGTVLFAGLVAGRPVVTVGHADGLRTTHEPVSPAVRPGDRLAAGTPLGALLTGHSGCPAPACLHWGLRRGADYLDPLALLGLGPVRLLPLDGVDPGPTPSARAPFASAPTIRAPFVRAVRAVRPTLSVRAARRVVRPRRSSACR